MLQYFAYVEIKRADQSGLWNTYEQLIERYPQLAMRRINGPPDIYPVFHDLFKRRDSLDEAV